MGGGPTSTSYVVPPRPKPGRKPATDEPASKRKAQNRESQRAFRARKAAKVSELQQQVDTTEQKHRKEVNDKIAELNQKEIEIRELKVLLAQLQEAEKRAIQERDYWKERSAHDQAQNSALLQQLKARGGSISAYAGAPFFTSTLPNSRQDSPTRDSISSFTSYGTPKAIDIGCGNCKANGECACLEEMAKISTPTNSYMSTMPLVQEMPRTIASPMKGLQAHTPPADSAEMFADREIDFTAQFSSKRPRLDTRPSIAFITQTSESDSSCGFCTDESNCLCKDESLRTLQMQRSGDQVALPPRDWTRSLLNSAKSTQNNCSTSGPGSCDDCQVNPRQRAWCQRVAQLRGSGNEFMSSRSSSRNSSIGSALDPLAPRTDNAPARDMSLARYSIGCSDAFKLLDGRVPMDNDKMDWISNLNPVSPHTIRRDTLPTLEPQRKYSALELDTAGVIATLQQSMAPLMPRKSDGPNVDLVRMAQVTQQSSASPE
ncbi:hypothetical protein K505DRAFT_305145 [Melanomma pulvis-pyrius CBS 109.77]|uniref:BZIP domain-containing protein n=1 Tax=Melanomma pulvis-pyrius CBS 109.77 TaxID=1314802 RepID=A0A6A6XCE6_9PLEO|nr:hypothetical protein K505DRAFT_305145 [Melanomma pulvis-pyrius CBS 109.77]